MKRLLINNDLEREWWETVLAQFKALFRNFPGRTEKKYDRPQSG
jgi:hypothetical protein